MKFKVIVTDLDGTALDSPREKVVSTRLRRAVESLEARGIKVCVATGRAESFARSVIESMGLRHPAIVSGGARIVDPQTRRELWGKVMSEQQMDAVMDVVKYSQYHCLRNEWNEEEYLGGASEASEFEVYVPTYIFVICFVESDKLSEATRDLSEIDDINVIIASSHRKGTFDIHITHKDASKEHAIYELEKILGVAKEDMIGVGDGLNDIHLFHAVGHRVAMGNAADQLKTAADEVIGTIEGDGLARYFEKIAEELEE